MAFFGDLNKDNRCLECDSHGSFGLYSNSFMTYFWGLFGTSYCFWVVFGQGWFSDIIL